MSFILNWVKDQLTSLNGYRLQKNSSRTNISPIWGLLHFPGGSEGKASACDAEDPGSIPGLGRSPGEGNGNPLQYSCLENPMDRGAWRTTVHGVAKSQTRLSDYTQVNLSDPKVLPMN